MHSKNDVFNTDWSVRPPPPIKPVDYSSSNGKNKQSPDVKTIPTITEPPATPAIKPSDGLEVRLLTHQELGHGRHATVHLALYREQHEAHFLQAPQDSSSPPHHYHKVHDESSTWKICAAKRFAAGKDSQVAGLSEALMLSKLAKCQSVLKYIGLKDDRPLSRPSSSRGNSSTEASDFDSNTQGSDGADPPSSRPSISRSHSNVSVSTPSSPVLKPSVHNSPIPGLMGLHQRQQEESKASLRRNATVKAPKAPSQLSHGRQPLAISTHNLNDDAPRMLLLTEYCALGNLAVFVLQHGPNVLGKRMFFKFAIDLMTALAAVHEKNIIHGDIKPQNCMIDASFNLKLGDFSSSLFNSPDLDDGIGLGTTQYSSPEVVRMPPSPFSFPIDIFSAGLTLLFIITGVQPYEALTMSSCNKSDRFAPKSPRGTPGNVTPTGVSMTKRKYRSSSGAGKMVELHVHLSKGHAWEWEERRRLQELEDNFLDDSVADQTTTPDRLTPIYDFNIPLLAIDAATVSSDLDAKAVELLPDHVTVPEQLRDTSNAHLPTRSHRQTYSDGYTPIQYFLHGDTMVPEALRTLIKCMLDPQAAKRPTAERVLEELKALQHA